MKKKKEKKKNIISELKLHEAQYQVHENPSRFKVLVAGRRTGKSRLMLTEIINECFNYEGEYDLASPPVVLLGMPSLKQARAVHWSSFINLLAEHPLVDKIYKSDFRITFKGLRPDLLIRGCNDNQGDSLRGLKIYFAGIDEFQDVNPVVWENVIYPALSDTVGSKALLIGTPNQGNKYFKDMYDLAEERKDWSSFHFTTYDNKYFPRERLEEAKKLLPPRIFEQEFMASWVNFGGQIYMELTKEHLIPTKEIPFKSMDEYFVGIDWGDINPATVIIGKKRGIYYVVDFWLNPIPGNPISADTHLKETLTKCVQWGVTRGFADPSSPAKIMDFRKGGVPKLIKGLNPVSAGNAIVSSLLHQERLYISEKCQTVYDNMSAYHRETKDGIILENVAKGQDDHLCDSTRYVLATLEHKKIFENLYLPENVIPDYTPKIKNSLYF